jgi:hypothetical protein
MKLLGRFVAAWGTLWLVMFAIALAAKTSVNLGTDGMVVALLGCAVYAVVRSMVDGSKPDPVKQLEQDNAALRALLHQMSGVAPMPGVPTAYVHRGNAPHGPAGG